MRRYLAFALLTVLVLTLDGCAGKNKYENLPNPVATISLEDGRQMRVELAVSCAPNTVANFVSLANSGFYDGMSFFRVMPGCLIQTGDPEENGTGGPGYAIRGEFAENGYEGNTLSHVRGVISMARLADDYDSAGSQFFILQGSYPEYDGRYAAFGTIMDEQSLEVLDEIALVTVDRGYSPLEKTYISAIRVDTKGYEYEPRTLELNREEEEDDESEQTE